MVDHHIQKKIIAKLVDSKSARYGDLKPDSLEGNVFTYHLHNLIKQKLISKKEDGSYQLTAKGMLYGINSKLSSVDYLEQAHSVIFISAVNEQGQWLLRKRLAQPMYGYIGFMHGEPKAGQTIQQSAEEILKYRTGLRGDFEFKGSGYVHMHQKGETVAYTSFSLVTLKNIRGDFIAKDFHGENSWYNEADILSNENMLPSMTDIIKKIKEPGLFFLEKSYEI
jgi:hypothetical protein